MHFPLLDRHRFFAWSGALAALGSRLVTRPLATASPSGSVYTRPGLRPIINPTRISAVR
jgi:hypothetical protein